MSSRVISNVTGLLGAILGGVVGYVVVDWLKRQNFYGMMIPGVLVGLGCSLLSRHRSKARGIACGIGALVLGLYCEARLFPFTEDSSLKFFVMHIPNLTPVSLVMIALGGYFAFSVGRETSAVLPGLPYCLPADERRPLENGGKPGADSSGG